MTCLESAVLVWLTYLREILVPGCRVGRGSLTLLLLSGLDGGVLELYCALGFACPAGAAATQCTKVQHWSAARGRKASGPFRRGAVVAGAWEAASLGWVRGIYRKWGGGIGVGLLRGFGRSKRGKLGRVRAAEQTEQRAHASPRAGKYLQGSRAPGSTARLGESKRCGRRRKQAPQALQRGSARRVAGGQAAVQKTAATARRHWLRRLAVAGMRCGLVRLPFVYSLSRMPGQGGNGERRRKAPTQDRLAAWR